MELARQCDSHAFQPLDPGRFFVYSEKKAWSRIRKIGAISDITL
jgi:hypothetical protein